MKRFEFARLIGFSPLAPVVAPLAKIAPALAGVTWRFVEEEPEIEGFCRAAPGWWRFYPNGSGELVIAK